MNRTAVVILSHGSPNEVEVHRLMEYVTQGVKSCLASEIEVEWAALQFNHPDLKEAVGKMSKRGLKRVVIMPYFLLGGRHFTKDIPDIIEDVKQSHPDMEFILTDTLGMDGLLVDIIVKRIYEALPESMFQYGSYVTYAPEQIESRSMAIIESLLPPLNCSNEERQVIKRIVHAAGDPGIASFVRFHSRAISCGVEAIRKNRPVFTDVKMVSIGINRNLAEKFGCPVTCALDEAKVIKKAQEQNATRAATAIHYLGAKLNDAIVVIGNAPTALFALLDLIDSRDVLPAVIIGMPVGFVGAKESKAELMTRDVPYLTIEGNRGGSTLAVATVNALMGLAEHI